MDAIVAKWYHSLALKNGKVIAWGHDVYDLNNVPTEAQNGVSAIAAGSWHSLALKNGKVIAWGWNLRGQTNVPTDAQSGVSAIAAGGVHNLALIPSGGSAGTLQFSASSASVNENAGNVTLTVTRSGGSSGAASVNYATQNGTAIAGTDYTTTSGTTNWADGNSDSKTITIPISNRTGTQGERAFTVQLSNASGASLGSPSSCSVNILDVAEPFNIVGYVTADKLISLSSSQAAKCTDIIFSFIWPEATGLLNTSELTAGCISKLQELKNSYGVRVLVAVGGGVNSGNFGVVAANSVTRSTLIERLMNLCQTYSFDGIDFDWEFPADTTQQANYETLLSETKDQFNQYDLLVTVALNTDLQIDYQTMKNANYSMVDRVHLMSYDRDNNLGYHATYEQSTIDVEQRFLGIAGVPKQKLCLGVPFYGVKVVTPADYHHPESDYKTYADIVDECHPADNVDLVDYPNVGYVYFNGIDTIKQKTRYAMNKQIGGIMIWQLGQDTTELTLLNAIKDTTVNTQQLPIPDIKANDLDFFNTVSTANGSARITYISTGTPLNIAVNMDAGDYAGVPVDWWVVALAGSSWFYMDSAVGWTQFDGNLSNCHPVYQGALGNLSPTDVLNMTGLPVGSYTFWFAVDYPMDGILDINGQFLVDSVNVVVQ